MNAIRHTVTHSYQPTANTCGYTALSILLSHFGTNVDTMELVDQVPQPLDVNGKPAGSVSAQLATWCLNEGWKVNFYAFDCQVLDLSWHTLDSKEILHKLQQIQELRVVPGLGKHWTEIYIKAYMDMLRAGGNLQVQPHVTSKLLYRLLQKGPVYANYCATVVNGNGRRTVPDPTRKESVPDDINGKVANHSVVIYGNDEKGNFLVADPWRGMRTIDCETMLCGITAAQIECDNLCFQLS